MCLTKESLLNARKDAIAQTISLRLKREFKKKDNNIWIIVEGKDDPCYYLNTIIHIIPDDWEVTPLVAGNKKNVISVFNSLDWRIYKKKRILFFVDRDLSDFTGDIKVNSKNFYVTDGYSIENSLICEYVLLRILVELLGLQGLTENEINSIKSLFQNAKKVFINKMTIPMIIILCLTIKKFKINELDRFNIKDIFSFSQGVCFPQKTDKQIYDYTIQLFDCSNAFSKSFFRKYKKVFTSKKHYENLIRGKYALFFLVLFANSIRDDWNSFSFKRINARNRSLSLGINNAFEQIAVRARTTPSLQAFYKQSIIGDLQRDI